MMMTRTAGRATNLPGRCMSTFTLRSLTRTDRAFEPNWKSRIEMMMLAMLALVLVLVVMMMMMTMTTMLVVMMKKMMMMVVVMVVVVAMVVVMMMMITTTTTTTMAMMKTTRTEEWVAYTYQDAFYLETVYEDDWTLKMSRGSLEGVTMMTNMVTMRYSKKTTTTKVKEAETRKKEGTGKDA